MEQGILNDFEGKVFGQAMQLIAQYKEIRNK